MSGKGEFVQRCIHLCNELHDNAVALHDKFIEAKVLKKFFNIHTSIAPL